MEAIKVRTPYWQTVMIAGKDVTKDINPYVRSITYTDHAHGASDEVDLELEDSTGLWRGSWYPTQGDSVVARMGYAGAPLLPCGEFEIEEVQISGPPDIMHIRALASGIREPQRTIRSQAYEGTSLRGIALAIARRHKFELVGEIADIRLNRITQHQEPDLGFLKRLAGNYGYVFTVKGKKLVFSDYAKLRATPPVLTINRVGDFATYNLQDHSLEVYKDSVCAYDDPKTKSCHTHKSRAKGVQSGDTRKITRRCENQEQAKLQSRAELMWANDGKFEGTLSLEGNTRLVAGNSVELAGFGHFDGIYLIDTSKHTMQPAKGYVTDITVKRGYEAEGDDNA